MTGRILDMDTQAPVLAYVRQGDAVLAMSDDGGRWVADVAVPARLLFTAVGYEPITVDVYTDDDFGNVYMVPLVTTLDPVVVEGPDRAVFPWWLVALFAAAAMASHTPRRRR